MPLKAVRQGVSPLPLKRQAAPNGKCRAATKAGRQYAAPAVRGGIYCALHNDPDRAARLGRKGGANNRKVYEGNQREIPPPQNARDVKNFLADAMAEIRAGKMEPKLLFTHSFSSSLGDFLCPTFQFLQSLLDVTGFNRL
jgi:general stress protein YciG